LAEEAGNGKAANTVMLGVMMALGITRLSEEAFELAIAESFAKKPKLVPLNVEMLRLGAKWARANLNLEA
jgi:2-oxoisovalerate ferredoxin oxidoreductase beta subunit